MPNPVKIRPLASARKLSRGLFEQLAEQIKSGRLAPGSRLPTEEALTRAARVSACSVGRRAPGAKRPLRISSASCSNRRRESFRSAATGRMRMA